MTGLEPLLVAGLVAGGATAGVSVLEANQQNKATQRAADTEKATQDAAAQQRQELTARRLLELEGSIRASSAGRGVAGSAVETSLLGSTFESALLESDNIETNRFFQGLSTQSRADASFQSPLGAGINGFSTGFSLGTSLGGFGSGGGGTGSIGDSFNLNLDGLNGTFA